MGINAFKSQFQDLARPNRFKVSIPGVVDSPDHMLCIRAELPGISLSSEPLYDSLHTGAALGSGNSYMPFQMPYDVVIKELPLTFMDTPELKLRKKFGDWFKEVFDPTKGFGYMDEYVKKVTITFLDRSNFPQYEAILYNAYPMSIDEFELDATMTDEYATFTVQLSYSSFELTPDDGLGKVKVTARKLFGREVSGPTETQDTGQSRRVVTDV